MPTFATDLKSLKRAVLALPDDPAPKLALADCAEDGGDAALAAGLRWCAARGKWPRDDMATSYRSWAWYSDYGQADMAARGDRLPRRLWDEVMKSLPPSSRTRYVYRGCEALSPFVVVRRLGRVLLVGNLE